MSGEKGSNIILVVLRKYIRLDDVIRWTAISFIGFILGSTTFSFPDILFPFFVFLIATFFIMSFIFAINNYYDADADKENPRRMHKNAIASGEISKRAGMALNILFILLSLLVVLLFRPDLLYFAILLLVWSAAYSIPPLRTKGRPGLDVVWHFFGFFFFILWGSLMGGSLPFLSWLMAISLGVFSCVGQLWNHYVDYEFDKESQTKTFAVRVGLVATRRTLNVVLALHLVLLLILFILFSSHYLITIVIVFLGLLLGYIVFRPMKGGFPTRRSLEFYLTIIMGGSVYISCVLYHLFSVLGVNLIQLY